MLGSHNVYTAINIDGRYMYTRFDRGRNNDSS